MSLIHCLVSVSAAVFFVLGLQVTPSHAAGDPLKFAMLIPGNIDDGGFMEAGYNGLLAIQQDLDAETRYISNVTPETASLIGALQSLADGQPDMIIAHGGQNSEAVEIVAVDYPDIRFVVVQGNVTGNNLSSYEVLQEESAWLAGAAAGLLTETGVVGHISGIRVTPGLKGRGAFYNGLMHTNPDAEFLTAFAGDQDDKQLAHDVASAEIGAGADIIFTMLNSGREGATDAMREQGVKQFGNVRDWVPVDPDVFVGSAIADVSMAALAAARDLAEGKWQAGQIVQMGLDDSDAVNLTLGADVSDEVRAQLNELRHAIIAEEIDVSVSYDGKEFEAR